MKISFEVELPPDLGAKTTSEIVVGAIGQYLPDVVIEDTTGGHKFKTDSRTHCDDFIVNYMAPECLRAWLLIKRLPAAESILLDRQYGTPPLFATRKGTSERVRLVMASRMGDVGITSDLEAEHGYDRRVMLGELADFSSSADGA